MAFFVILLGLLPGFAWLAFYLFEDPHPEPKRLIALTFFTGIVFAFFAVALEHFLNSAAGGVGIEEFSVVSLLSLAFVEEFVKFGAAYFSISKTPEIADPIDPMIYMIVAALGFATLENIGTLATIPVSGNFFSAAFQTIMFRFVGATLLHSLTSAIVGFYWSFGVARGKTKRYVGGGLLVATALHATFNYLILNYQSLAYSAIFLIMVGFFVLADFETLKRSEPNQT